MYLLAGDPPGLIFMIFGLGIIVFYLFYRIFKSGATFKAPGQSWDSARNTAKMMSEVSLNQIEKEDPELVKKAIENLKKGMHPANPISVAREIEGIKKLKRIQDKKDKLINTLKDLKSKTISTISNEDKLQKLEKLFELKQKGALSEEEYLKEKKKLLK